ncbi:cytochrome oxidase putative small subunit CydP [Undibacterium terreum]|uniref:Uncharacterized protein n=1 Tax=Undibacterium terreum TaxID=1224302 RepID=A0A916UHK2_9BURK|nr:cytochrome oxidase putative small subunit CydP [Undibacterium terreum]GGC73937.1 hypothetical protein GCM10011396_21440 [Undibacterium terreum]
MPAPPNRLSSLNSKWPLPRLTRLPLAVEITLALLIKILILTLLWKFFFSHPQVKKMRMPLPQVEQHLLAETPATKLATAAPAVPAAPPISNTTDKGSP